jgi:hypothetical protein
VSAIFLSYASQDRDAARELAAQLEANGHSVWWDRTIPPGRVFDEVIQEALESARCVIVLWSSHSVRSNWVKVEAEEASARGILVPVFVEHVMPPIQFKRIQAANLTGWGGDTRHPEFRNLLSSIEGLLGRSAAAAMPAMPNRHASAITRRATPIWLAAVGGGAAMLALVAAVLALRGDDVTSGGTPTPTGTQAPVTTGSQGSTSGASATSNRGAEPSSSSAPTTVPPPVRRGDLINLLSAENGGELLAAADGDWAKTVDGDENTGLWVTFYSGGKSEAVFGFKNDGFATVEGIEILVPGASGNNVGELELLTGTESAHGRFDPVQVFKTRNMLIVKERYQRFMFPPRTARYVKVRVLRAHAELTSTGLNEWRLLGTLNSER